MNPNYHTLLLDMATDACDWQNADKSVMRKTRKLCAVMLDTTGREIMVMREHEIDEKGWPEHVNRMEVKEGQKVCLHICTYTSPEHSPPEPGP